VSLLELANSALSLSFDFLANRRVRGARIGGLRCRLRSRVARRCAAAAAREPRQSDRPRRSEDAAHADSVTDPRRAGNGRV
jgi:hypothetical protein